MLATLAQKRLDAAAAGIITTEPETTDAVTSALESCEIESIEPPEAEVRHCRGTAGTTINVAVNYIKMSTDPDKGVFEYLVDFSPQIAAKNIRVKLLGKMRDVIGETRTFDGVTLYLPIKLEERVTNGEVEDKKGEKYKISITFKKQKRLSVSEK